jgi:hypothetical protein
MASQDDQISDKRRRLFKALSAAPVVATLRPGEALANTSAFQCLVTPPPPSATPVRLIDPDAVPACQHNCIAFDQRFYWKRSFIEEQIDNIGTENKILAKWDYVVGPSEEIVLVNARIFSDVALYAVDTSDFNNPPSLIDDTAFQITAAGKLQIDGGGSHLVTLDGSSGLFQLDIEPNADNTHFTVNGVYPDATDGDPLGESCWNSLNASSDTVRFLQG